MYKVLLVDDEAIARIGLRSTFDWEGHGFRLVGEASNGMKAMPWIDRGDIDILITDIAMPVMDGLELTRLAKQRIPWLTVLLLSCHNDFEYVREGIRLGASDYLLKPTLETDDLKKRLHMMKDEVDKARQQIEMERIWKEHLQKEGKEDNAAEAPPSKQTYHSRLIQQSIQYIRDYYREPIGLQDAADHISLSRNYFCELFKKETGMNFTDYVNQVRVEKASELLQTTRMRVYEVADNTGFNDVKYFSKLFKKHTGMSPAEYQGARI